MVTGVPTPLPEELRHALEHSAARVLCHDIVMDAIDLSLALDRHVLLYSLEGLFVLETEQGSWRLAPSRGAWITAGTLVQATTIKPVRCTSLFFTRSFAAPLVSGLSVFDVPPVVREMFRYAGPWAEDAHATEPERERFFLTLLDLCRTQIQRGVQPALPKARSEELVRVLRFTQRNLAKPIRLEDAAREAAMSPRTLMRRLSAEIHMTWGQYLHIARMLHAMECLARGMPVTETAFEAGYTSMAAFSTAFRRFTDDTPTRYRAQF